MYDSDPIMIVGAGTAGLRAAECNENKIPKKAPFFLMEIR